MIIIRHVHKIQDIKCAFLLVYSAFSNVVEAVHTHTHNAERFRHCHQKVSLLRFVERAHCKVQRFM